MNQVTHFSDGAIAQVGPILDRLRPRSLFVVTSPHTYAASGAQAALTTVLDRYAVAYFTDFSPNPKLPDVAKALGAFRGANCDALLAVGGGSCLDLAKLVSVLSVNEGDAADIVRGGRKELRKGSSIVAVPTTAGSGAEATPFAVAYIGKTKYSLSDPALLPDYVIVDPELTYSLSPRQTAISGMDALSQAIESLWSVNSTEESCSYASNAIALAVENLEKAVHNPSPAERHAMSHAANLAGRAISVTRTTAPHALSYTMTSQFGVPHGHAVAMTLGEMLVYNSQVQQDDVIDPRGVDHVKGAIDHINRLLGMPDASASRFRLANLMNSIGLSTRLSELGIESPDERQLLADTVNVERLNNNPRRLSREDILNVFDRIA